MDKRYQYDSILQEPRSIRYLLRLFWSTLNFSDFWYALATIGLIGTIMILSALFTRGK